MSRSICTFVSIGDVDAAREAVKYSAAKSFLHLPLKKLSLCIPFFLPIGDGDAAREADTYRNEVLTINNMHFYTLHHYSFLPQVTATRLVRLTSTETK
jgi:hypothetical protein